jgi:hypothetical protein
MHLTIECLFKPAARSILSKNTGTMITYIVNTSNTLISASTASSKINSNNTVANSIAIMLVKIELLTKLATLAAKAVVAHYRSF